MIKAQLIKVYRALPKRLRNMIYYTPLTRGMRQRHFESDTRLHDELYTKEYYENEFWYREGATILSKVMIERFHPASVLDVGCGTGDYLKAFSDHGIEAHGIELARAALERCHEKSLNVLQLDLTATQEYPWSVDLVYSIEVAEHLPESVASTFVKALCTAARRGVVISAAAPGQPGLCHVNCREKSYWINLFEHNGFGYDEATTGRWLEENRTAGNSNWIFENLMVFEPVNN